MRYTFEEFSLDTNRRELRRGIKLVAVEPRVFDLLAHLVDNRSRVVSKDELLQSIWGGRIVSESALTTCINAARTALNDSGAEQRLIRTLPRKGLRFTGDVVADAPSSPNGTTPASLHVAHDLGDATGLVRPSIAVLPFDNMSGDPEQDYFASGVARDVTNALAKLRWLLVVASTSSSTYADQPIDVQRIGRELGVRYVLEGCVRKAGGRIRSTAQLIEARSRTHIWVERYEHDVTDVFELQDELTRKLVAAVEPSLIEVEIARATAKSTENLEAYDYYLRALWEGQTATGEAWLRAEALLRRAIELDPHFADALAGLADCISTLVLWGDIENMEDAHAEARRLAVRAVVADPQNGSALAVAADALLCCKDGPRAVSLAERALRASPDSAFVLKRCGRVYVYKGDYDRAIEIFKASLQANPRDPRDKDAYHGLTLANFFARRFEEAVFWARKMATESFPQSPTRRFAAAALAHLGRSDEARAEIAEVLRLQPNSSLRRSRKSPHPQPWMLELYLDGLRKAGLPET